MPILVDGLCSDQIAAVKMPALFVLQNRAVAFEAHHSIFPTVTRVNASTIATGTYPEHGILSNLPYIPEASSKLLSKGESRNLILRVTTHGDRILARSSLREAMVAQGKHAVAITSGSLGAATLLAPEARHGAATLVDADLVEGQRVAYPPSLEHKTYLGEEHVDDGER